METALVATGLGMILLSVLGFTRAWPLIRGASWGLLSLGTVLLLLAWVV